MQSEHRHTDIPGTGSATCKTDSALRRRRLLLVEDNLLIATAMKRHLESCEFRVVGPVRRVAEAIRVVREARLDGAILDLNLGEETVWPVAELLEERHIPFIFASGYANTRVPPQFSSRTLLRKPLTERSLRNALCEAGLIR